MKKTKIPDFSPPGGSGSPIWPRNWIPCPKLQRKQVSVQSSIIENFRQSQHLAYWVQVEHPRKSVKKKLSPFLSPGWKFFIRQLWSDNRFYCNFLRRIRIWSLQAPRDTPCGVKLAFLGRKPQISGVKNQFFCIFHPGNIPDCQFDPGIRSGIKNYIRKGGQIISVALF